MRSAAWWPPGVRQALGSPRRRQGRGHRRAVSVPLLLLARAGSFPSDRRAAGWGAEGPQACLALRLPSVAAQGFSDPGTNRQAWIWGVCLFAIGFSVPPDRGG